MGTETGFRIMTQSPDVFKEQIGKYEYRKQSTLAWQNKQTI